MLSRTDKKPERPVIIVQGPRQGVAIVIVYGRTSDLGVEGVYTPAGTLPDLTKPGVFAPRHQQHIHVADLRAPACRFAGVLPEPYRTQVLSLWMEL
ncbi:hypothetical protein [Aeromicrobium sp. WCS2018Hpa-31]|uniref:hypothetical protein n=1 Tax=Aeromicrobium sp. WCS2018Hpa-31 TaxID=3073628 RepID=UPI002882FB34|nr:hypothetical protein [Aeromicrobium sp. WCS2018Hpa-31]